MLDTSKGLAAGQQYGHRLPLKDKEIVLTFDDGPLPLYSERVRKALKAECVQATYFLVGKNALAHPAFVRKLAGDGHSLGTHTMTHAMNLNALPEKKALAQVDSGILAVARALRTPENKLALAPFFRFPGLNDNKAVRATLEKRGMGVFDIDMEGGDWLRTYSSDDVLNRVMGQLKRERKGIVLLHDIQPRTAAMLPKFLRLLKQEGYQVVHLVPAAPALVDDIKIASTDKDLKEVAQLEYELRSDEDRMSRQAENQEAPAIPPSLPQQTANLAPPPQQTAAAPLPLVQQERGMSKEVEALLKTNPAPERMSSALPPESVQVTPPSVAFAASAPAAEPLPAGSDRPRKARHVKQPHPEPAHATRLNLAVVRYDRTQDDIEKAYALRRARYEARPREASVSAAYAPQPRQQHYVEAAVGSRAPASKYFLNSLYNSLRGTN